MQKRTSINDKNRFPKVYVYRYVIALNNRDIKELSTDEILYQKSGSKLAQIFSAKAIEATKFYQWYYKYDQYKGN